jgi:hypothetical protein
MENLNSAVTFFYKTSCAIVSTNVSVAERKLSGKQTQQIELHDRFIFSRNYQQGLPRAKRLGGFEFSSMVKRLLAVVRAFIGASEGHRL